MVHWFAWKQVKQNGKMERTAVKHFLVRFWNFEKQTFSPNWRADRSGPEWRHR